MLMRVSGESVAGVAASCKQERRDDWKKADTEDTVSPLGAKRPTLPALGRFERLAEAFKSGEEKAGSIKHIGKADTLPTEGFYD